MSAIKLLSCIILCCIFVQTIAIATTRVSLTLEQREGLCSQTITKYESETNPTIKLFYIKFMDFLQCNKAEEDLTTDTNNEKCNRLWALFDANPGLSDITQNMITKYLNCHK